MKLLGITSALFGAISAVLGLLSLSTDGLGFPAGVCGLLAGGAGLVLLRSAVAQRRDLVATRTRLEQLEHATAEQIQARLTAEADARVAQHRAQKAELGSDLLADRLRTIRARTTGSMKQLTDPLTGLYGEEYFSASVDARVASARRHLRPVTVVLIEAVVGVSSGTPQPADAMQLSRTLADTLREADTACRLIDGRFALVLEDTPENGAIWTVERFRRQLVNEIEDITVWAGVAGYPAHAFDADTVVRLAEEALHSARDWGRDRIEVAPSP
jgi:GGDEF domain-containing protein